MSDITIYHNSNCSTSRNTLALLRERGIEPTVVEYLRTPLSPVALKELTEKIGITPRQLLRRKGTPYEELELDNPKWTDAEIIGFMHTHPILMERPVVVTPLGARLCRPMEKVLEILPAQ
jgi:arsenate reductase